METDTVALGSPGADMAVSYVEYLHSFWVVFKVTSKGRSGFATSRSLLELAMHDMSDVQGQSLTADYNFGPAKGTKCEHILMFTQGAMTPPFTGRFESV